MSHPIPTREYGENERDDSFAKKSSRIPKVKKYKYGINKKGNNVDKFLKHLEKKKEMASKMKLNRMKGIFKK